MFALLGCMCGVYMTIIIHDQMIVSLCCFFLITPSTEIEFIEKYCSQPCRYFLFIGLHLNGLMGSSLLLPFVVGLINMTHPGCLCVVTSG